MPHRPGLDDDDALKALIDTWKEAELDLRRRASSVAARLDRELRNPVDRNRIVRLQALQRRIEALQKPVSLALGDLRDGTRRWIESGGLADVYAAGAAGTSLPFSFTLPHRRAVDVFAVDLWDDVLAMTEFVDGETKRVISSAAQVLGRLAVTASAGTPDAQARRLASQLKRQGIASVVYRDGRRVGIGTYSEMLLRTKTGVAYNAGSLNASRAAGIRWVELLDGTDCGLTGHKSTPLANGLVVPLEVAEEWPLSHPNCRRAIAPRPDLDRGAPDPSWDSAGARNPDMISTLRAQAASRRRGSSVPPSAASGGWPSWAEQRIAGGRLGEVRSTNQLRIGDEYAASLRSGSGHRDGQLLDTLVNESIRFKSRPSAERLASLGVSREQFDDAVTAARRAANNAARRERRPRKPDADTLARLGITGDEWDAARRRLRPTRAAARDAARREQDDIFRILDDMGAAEMARPDRLRQSTDALGRTRYVRDSAGYDWLEQVSSKDRDRLWRHWLTPDAELSPDEIAASVRAYTKRDLTDDEALAIVRDLWDRHDGYRSLASGRLPSHIDAGTLTPPEFDELGLSFDRLFGDKSDSILHIAEAEQTLQSRVARSMFTPRTGDPMPYLLPVEDFIDEVELLESWVPSLDPRTVNASERYALDRWAELVPAELDGEGVPLDVLWARIRETARIAGLVDDTGSPIPQRTSTTVLSDVEDF